MIQRLVNYVNNLSAIGIALNYADVEALYLSVDEKVRKNASILLLPLAAANGVVYGMDMRGGLVPFDFSRVTEATYFDKDLNLQIVDSNIPRIDYGNYSKEAKLLIEKSSTNSIRQLSIIAQNGTLSNVTEKYQSSKLYRETNVDSYHRVSLSLGENSRPITKMAQSFLLKYDGTRKYAIVRTTGTVNNSATIDLENKVVTNVNGSIELDIDYLGDNWMRILVKQANPLSEILVFWLASSLIPNSPSSQPSFVGDTSSGWIYSYVQTELESDENTSIIPTTTSAVTRSADNLSYALKNNCFVYLKTTNQEVILDKQAGLWNIHEDLNNEGIEALAIMPDNRLSNVLIDIASAPVTQDNTLAAINIDKAEYQHIDAVKKLGGVNVGKEAAGENTSFVYYL